MRVAVLSGARRFATTVLVGSLLGACSVDQFAAADSAPKVVNGCEEDSDCQTEGANAVACSKGICVASSGDIIAAYVEVKPPAAAYYGAGESFLVPLESLDRGNWNRDLLLPSYAEVTGQITVSPGLLGEPPSEACEQAYEASSQSLRVHVELSRSNAVLGLPSLTVAANAELVEISGKKYWKFSEKVPPGRYDLYATALAGCDADFPPVFAPGQVLDPGTVTLALHIGALSTLSGIVTPPGDGSLAGWQVSLVEPDRGRLVSTTRTLNESNPTNFKLLYQPISDVAPLLRLSPPEGIVAPEVIWDLSVLDLDGNGQVAPNLEGLDLKTVNVRGRVIDSNVASIAGASVRLRSTALQGAPKGLTARYETVVTSDEEGSISLDVLPGTYQLIVTPPDPLDLSITETTWVIASSPDKQAGRTVEVAAKRILNGSVFAPVDGQPLRGTTVSVLPSAVVAAKYLDRALSPARVTPRMVSGFTDDLGAFSILMDPGSVDVSIKPSESSSFPWLVRARIDVPGHGAAASPGPSLEQMRVSFPVPLAGTLLAPGGEIPVQSALLRVFALLDSNEPTGLARDNDPITGDGVLQVAEGRTDESGNFVLLLPSKLFSE
jgi:hypothetical protein